MAKPNSAVPGSMLEGLQMVLGELGSMMATPDADPNFLTTLQHAIVGKIKQSTQHAITQQGPGGMAGGGGAPNGGMMGGGTQGLVNQSALQQAGAGGMGGVAGPSAQEQGPSGMANANEMGRVLGAQGVTG